MAAARLKNLLLQAAMHRHIMSMHYGYHRFNRAIALYGEVTKIEGETRNVSAEVRQALTGVIYR